MSPTDPLLRVRVPCSEEWDAMAEDGRGRFCNVCNMHVHDVSRMTEHEARELLAARASRVCVRFLSDAEGNVLYGAPEAGFVPLANVRASSRRRVAVGAGLVAAGLSTLMACGPSASTATAGEPMYVPTSSCALPSATPSASGSASPAPRAPSSAPSE
jgi:hypothetical protein